MKEMDRSDSEEVFPKKQVWRLWAPWAIVAVALLMWGICNSCTPTTKIPRQRQFHMEYFPPYYYEHYHYNPYYYYYSPAQRPVINYQSRPYRQGNLRRNSRRR